MKQTFKMFLEAEVKPFNEPTLLSFEEFHKVLTEDCSDAFNAFEDGVPIYRGWGRPVPAGIYDPSTGERKSQNTTNYYTRLMDTNPANSAWPKRSKSFICSTGKEHAEDFASGGELTYVFPFNGVKIAICPYMDLWLNELRLEVGGRGSLITINECNAYVEALGKYTGITINSFDSFKDALSGINIEDFAVICRGSSEYEFGFIVEYLTNEDNEDREEKFQELKTAWLELYTYDEYTGGEFQLVNNIQRAYLEDEGHEVWFSGECLICSTTFMEEYQLWLESEFNK